MIKTRIIIPCYNESARLNQEAFLDILENNDKLSFLFVNDGSSDNTLEVLSLLKHQKPAQIDFISLNHNVGKAEAVRRGILQAIDESFDYVGYWDADLATPLDAINDFSILMDSVGAEIIIGSRVRLLGRKVERKAIRHYLGRVFGTCASLLLRIPIYDTQCGAKLFKNTSILRQIFGSPFKVNWTFDVEMFARFSVITEIHPMQVSSKWIEFPLANWKDVQGSKIKTKDFINGAFELCLLFYYLYTPAKKRYKEHLTRIS